MALARSATTEALTHFRAALGDVAKLPESSERDRRELEIQRAMGSAMVAAHGFASPETGRAYERALELTEKIKDLTPSAAAPGAVGGDLRQPHARPQPPRASLCPITPPGPR